MPAAADPISGQGNTLAPHMPASRAAARMSALTRRQAVASASFSTGPTRLAASPTALQGALARSLRRASGHSRAHSTPLAASSAPEGDRRTWWQDFDAEEQRRQAAETQSLLEEVGMIDSLTEGYHMSTSTGGYCHLCSMYCFDGHELADHFARCFADYCPVASPRDAVGKLVGIVYQTHLGQARLPGAFMGTLLQSFLPPQSLLAFGQTSWVNLQLVDDDGLWAELVQKFWVQLWAQSPGGFPHGRCGCSFPFPATSSLTPKQQACALWNVQLASSVPITLQPLVGVAKTFVLADAEESATCQDKPLLLRKTVLDFKRRCSEVVPTYQPGHPSSSQMLVDPQTRHLSHDAAPLAAYVWSSFASSLQPQLRFDLIMQMSSGSGARDSCGWRPEQ